MTLELAIALLVAAGAVYFLFFRKKAEVSADAPYKVETPAIVPVAEAPVAPVVVPETVAEAPVVAVEAETPKAKPKAKPKAAMKAKPKAAAKTAKAPKKANIRVAK